MILLRCTETEKAINILAKHSESIMVRANYFTDRPVRVRPNDLEGRLFFRRAASAQSQMDAWAEQGGILFATPWNMPDFEHDFQVFCEAPLSLDWLRKFSDGTRVAAVVAQPINWRAHQVVLSYRAPNLELARAVEAHILAAKHADRAPMEALGVDPKGYVSLTDNALCKSAEVPFKYLSVVRKAVLKGLRDEYMVVQPYICRVPPRNKNLAGMYAAIKALPAVGGVHYGVGTALSKAAKFWNKQVRALTDCGSVEKQERLGFYRVAAIKPDFDGIEKRHLKATADLKALIAAIESAPLVTPAKVKSLLQSRAPAAQSQPSDAPAPLVSAARSRRTGD